MARSRARDGALDDLIFERKQVMELRQVLTEIFTCMSTGDPALLLDGDQIDEWRERSGLASS